MSLRKSMSKKLRFDVFKRDGFKCQYCGSCPPEVVLEPDHVNPVSNGGDNSIDNLITACFDCNRGKGARLLTSLPDSVSEKAEILAEKIEQIKAFERLIKSKKKHEEKQINLIEEAFQMYFTGGFAPKFRVSVRNFLQKLPAHVVEESMHRSCAKIKTAEDALKYFCGICWNEIKAQNGTR